MTHVTQHNAHAVATRGSFLVIACEGARDSKVTTISTSSEKSAAYTVARFIEEGFGNGVICEGYRDIKEDRISRNAQNLPGMNPRLPSLQKRAATQPRSNSQPLNWQLTMAQPGGSVELV